MHDFCILCPYVPNMSASSLISPSCDEFHSSLARGDVEYRVEGRSVAVIHDDDAADDSITVDSVAFG